MYRCNAILSSRSLPAQVRNITAILHAQEGTLFYAANRVLADAEAEAAYSWQNGDDWADAAAAEVVTESAPRYS